MPRALEIKKQNPTSLYISLTDSTQSSQTRKWRFGGILKVYLTSDTPKKPNFRPKSNFPVGH